MALVFPVLELIRFDYVSHSHGISINRHHKDNSVASGCRNKGGAKITGGGTEVAISRASGGSDRIEKEQRRRRDEKELLERSIN